MDIFVGNNKWIIHFYNMQQSFLKIIGLLELYKTENVIIEELLGHCLSTEITFSTFENDSFCTEKDHILNIYETQSSFEDTRPENQFVFGYDKLLPSLRKTNHKNICISDITSEKGCYLIFTNFEKSDLIGILKSKRTLTEIRAKYRQHKEMQEKFNVPLTYDYESQEIVFVNGKLLNPNKS